MNRRKIIWIWGLLTLVVSGVQAQAPTSGPFFVELGLKSSFLNAPDKVIPFIGGGLTVGIRLTPHGYVTAGISFGGSLNDEQIGSFEYEKTVTSDGHTTTTYHDDGEINRAYNSVTLLAGWQWEALLLKGACAFSVGPYVGLDWLKPDISYVPTPDNQPDTEDIALATMGVFGLGAGFRVKAVKLEYRFLLHTSPTIMDEKWELPMSHHIVVSFHAPW
ncbi:MAG: hypothetical protein LBS94_00340 [Prevotellaceae bacterium]|jgi:hypothetical protein|nr:hypothetical protein [Prevotellaceae bacterium]